MERINGGTCEERNLALVSTRSECNEAALKLGESKEVQSARGFWPYCYYDTSRAFSPPGIFFDPFGTKEGRPAHIDTFQNEYGLCKNGTAHTTATPVLKPP